LLLGLRDGELADSSIAETFDEVGTPEAAISYGPREGEEMIGNVAYLAL